MKRILLLVVFAVSLQLASIAQDQTIPPAGGSATFNMSGTLTVDPPAACGPGETLMGTVTYEIWGGGGAGCYFVGTSTDFSYTQRGAGGGGGGYSTGTIPISAGTFPVVVGTGGIVSTGTPNSAQSGGDSSFSGVISGGGVGGSNNPPAGGTGDVPGGMGGARGGGNNTTGDNGGGGGGSGPGATAGVSASNDGLGGAGGTPGGGAGGDNGAAGVNGTCGGGGGGKGSQQDWDMNPATLLSSGDGGDGKVMVTVVWACIVPTPVELVNFKATATNQTVQLDWQTASELNNEGFEIQRSVAGERWSVLEFMDGKGTTQNLNTYQCFDKYPTNGVNYYRLKQIDFDGQFEYSDIKTVNVRSDKPVTIRPTVVQDKIQVSLNSDDLDNTNYRVLNYAGQEMQTGALQTGNSSINVNGLNSGMYLLQVTSGGKNTVLKFVKL